MRINIEKILKVQANEFISDATFAYNDESNELDNEACHMIAQKTLYKVDVINTFLNNVISENEIQKSSIQLIRKMFKQTIEDIDYMYPNGELEVDNAHVVMQLIKRTGEDIGIFLECFQQKNVIESKIDMQEILKKQFKEYDKDIDYAYPETNYEDNNAHVVMQGLLGKSEFLSLVLENSITSNKEEKEFKKTYLEKLSGLLELLNSSYNKKGYYKNNGHDIFTELLESLKVELKDLSKMNIKDKEEIILFDEDKKPILKNSKVEHINVNENENNNNQIIMNENVLEDDKKIRNEEVKKKFKKMM